MIANLNTFATHGPCTNTRRSLTACVFSAVTLLLAPVLPAQSEPTAPEVSKPDNPQLYSMKFTGGGVESLEKQLKEAFPKDNVVVAPSAKYMKLGLSDFEIRDVRLNELGKTIEFLSDGKLLVEISERDGGAPSNTWRIGSRLATTPATLFQLKMRSVAAPCLFGSDKAKSVQNAAADLEALRLKRILESDRAGYNEVVGGARVELLPEQNIMVIIGSEDGVAGMESFIKAAEQLAADEAEWKKAQEKEKEDSIRKANDAKILAIETAKATRDALAEQAEATEECIDQKHRIMSERMEALKYQIVLKRKDLQAKVEEAKKEGPTSDAFLEAKTELAAHIQSSDRLLTDEESRINAQVEQLQSSLIDLMTKLRAADEKLIKLGSP